MQRRVLQELRTTPFDPGMRRFAKPGMKFLDQARLAQPWLAHDEYQLPVAVPSARPAPHEYRYFLITPDKWRQMALPRSAAASAGPHQPEQLYRFRHALQFMGAAFLGDEKAGDLALHLCCHQEGAWLRQRLHSRRSVGRIVNLTRRVDHNWAG